MAILRALGDSSTMKEAQKKLFFGSKASGQTDEAATGSKTGLLLVLGFLH
jgi:hypothetical protein